MRVFEVWRTPATDGQKDSFEQPPRRKPDDVHILKSTTPTALVHIPSGASAFY